MVYCQRSVRFVTLIVAACLILIGTPQVSLATGSGCRTDPILYFSNGDKVVVQVALTSSLENTNAIQYIVHAPSNVTVMRIVTTGPIRPDGTAAGRHATETVDIRYDQPPTGVTQTAYHTSVTALTDYASTVTAVMSFGSQSRTVTGTDGQQLELEVAR